MIGTTNTSARRLAVLALVAAAVAAIASPAPAAVRPNDRPGALGPGGTSRTHVQHAVRPDDRAGIRGVVAQSRVLRVLHPHVTTSGSFDWNDALVGAGVASAAAMLLLFTALALRRHVRLAPAAAVPSERSLR